MSDPQHFFGRLVGTRPTWPQDMTEAEGAVMGEHFQYLSQLVEAGKVLAAGPCFADPPFGLVLLATTDRAEAEALLAADPSVQAGLHVAEVTELRLSLWAGKPG